MTFLRLPWLSHRRWGAAKPLRAPGQADHARAGRQRQRGLSLARAVGLASRPDPWLPSRPRKALLGLRWRLPGRPAHPKGRLAVRRGRQLPCTRGRWADLGVDVHIQEKRLVGFDRVLERTLEVFRARD